MPINLEEAFVALTKAIYRLAMAEDLIAQLAKSVPKDIYGPIWEEANRKFAPLRPDYVARMKTIFLEYLPNATPEEIDGHLLRLRAGMN
jgi:hypothetical protein